MSLKKTVKLSVDEELLLRHIRESQIKAEEIVAWLVMMKYVPGGRRGRLRALSLGEKAVSAEKRSVRFEACVQAELRAKAHRRPRTLSEIRIVTARMMREVKGLAHRNMRSITREDCQKILSVFPTPQGRRKALYILHGVFSFALRHEWVSANPVRTIDIPVVTEREVPILSPTECTQLLQAAHQIHQGACVPGLTLMLYAGIRPAEVQRLQYKDIHLDSSGKGLVVIPAQHSKTGGGRRIPLEPVACRLLTPYIERHKDLEFICPTGWAHKWLDVRKYVGYGTRSHPWVQDILRHTFASYHLAAFNNISTLQYAMGHHHAGLLITRYLNLSQIRHDEPRQFWHTVAS